MTQGKQKRYTNPHPAGTKTAVNKEVQKKTPPSMRAQPINETN